MTKKVKLNLSFYISLVVTSNDLVSRCGWFGNEDAFDAFSSSDAEYSLFFNDSEDLVILINEKTEDILFGSEVVTKGIDEIFESAFNSTEKMRSLISVRDGDSSSELYWEGDARDIPSDEKKKFKKLLTKKSSLVVWKQIREIDWVVSSVDDLKEKISQGDVNDYSDFVAVF
jgi:hypothetical protein